MPTGESNADRLRQAYRDWEESKGGNADAFAAISHDDIAMMTAFDPSEPLPFAQPRAGKVFARDYLESLALNLEMLEFVTEEIVDGGDTVVWKGRCHWRSRANGREQRTVKVDVWHFRDGKAVSVLEMFDTLGFARFNNLV